MREKTIRGKQFQIIRELSPVYEQAKLQVKPELDRLKTLSQKSKLEDPEKKLARRLLQSLGRKINSHVRKHYDEFNALGESRRKKLSRFFRGIFTGKSPMQIKAEDFEARFLHPPGGVREDKKTFYANCVGNTLAQQAILREVSENALGFIQLPSTHLVPTVKIADQTFVIDNLLLSNSNALTVEEYLTELKNAVRDDTHKLHRVFENIGDTELKGFFDNIEVGSGAKKAVTQGYAHLAEASLRHGNAKNAIHFFKKALALDPENPYLHLRLGSAYVKADNHSQARYHFRKAGLGSAAENTAR
ncbi:TPA: tetratricopeptide repeat protein [Candidatus Micrarchaeota archaeon]|nr:tetratricopeptide repeat protein [Candidatus Micrarchaeota archaeon]